MAEAAEAATDEENAAIAAYDDLMSAKKKEVQSFTNLIKDKLQRVGDLGVEVQAMKNDLGDTADSLADDKKFLADLDKNCAGKQKLYAPASSPGVRSPPRGIGFAAPLHPGGR